MIRVGTLLDGYCDGWFGRDSYARKRVEGVGVDWVVVRNQETAVPELACVPPEELEQFVKATRSWSW